MKAQCTKCQWTGDEKQTRVRNSYDDQVEERCPHCGTYGSIIEAKKKRYTLTIRLNEWASNDAEARSKALERVFDMIKKEDNNATLQSLIEHPTGSLKPRNVAL